jgi:hypothetical protein
MKYRRLAAVAVFSAASAGYSAPVFSAPPPQGAFLREDGNYWMHGPHHDYIVGPASAYSAPGTHSRRTIDPRREITRDRHSRNRDRDRDGYERDRDNDGVPDSHDRDRDNDGVRNRHDSRPDNPRRH